MTHIEFEHFKLNRLLLLALGLWPYEQSLLAKIQFNAFFVILITFIIFQIAALWTPECMIDCAIKILSCVLFFTVSVIKYNSVRVNFYAVKYLLEHLKHICDGLRDKNEVDIMKHYGENSTRYTARIMLITLVCLCVIILLPILPLLLDIVLPTNDSRSRFVMPIVTCYFINQEKYAYLILLHAMVASYIGAIAIIGPGTLMISYLKHACGMFTIGCYRIQQAMANEKSKKSSFENKYAICKDIAYSVDIHRTAMEFSTYFMSNFEGSFFCLIAVIVTSLSLNLFLVYHSAVDGNNAMELLLHLTFVVVLLLYTFLANYAAQDVTDHYNNVFKTVYNVQWYNFSIQIQKIILFLLQRGTRPFYLNPGKIFIGSLETAATLMSTSVSYFTVLYSTRQ